MCIRDRSYKGYILRNSCAESWIKGRVVFVGGEKRLNGVYLDKFANYVSTLNNFFKYLYELVFFCTLKNLRDTVV